MKSSECGDSPISSLLIVIALVLTSILISGTLVVMTTQRNPTAILNEILCDLAPDSGWHVKVITSANGNPIAAIMIDDKEHVVSMYNPVTHGFDLAEAITWIETNVEKDANHETP